MGKNVSEYSVLSLRKGSSDISLFIERSWSKLTSFDDEISDQQSNPINQSNSAPNKSSSTDNISIAKKNTPLHKNSRSNKSTSLNRSNSSLKRKRAKPIWNSLSFEKNSLNNTTNSYNNSINSFNNSIQENENYLIEDASDDEPKVKRKNVRLGNNSYMIPKEDYTIENLSSEDELVKKSSVKDNSSRASSSKGNSNLIENRKNEKDHLNKQKLNNKSINKSQERLLSKCSQRLLKKDLNDLANKSNEKSKTDNQSTKSWQSFNNSFFKSKINSSSIISPKNQSKVHGSPIISSKIKSSIIHNSPILLKNNSNQISHSTPKVLSRIQNKCDHLVKDFSPFKQNNENELEPANSPLKSFSQNIETPDSPIFINNKNKDNSKLIRSTNKSKARTLFNSTNRKFKDKFKNEDFKENKFIVVNSPKKTESPKSVESLKRIGSPVESPLKSVSQSISTPESPTSIVKLKKKIVKTPTLTAKKFSNISNKDDHLNLNNDLKIKKTPIKSQYIISQVYSPFKDGESKAIESRCFLKLSKKVEKLIHQHNLSKLNSSKNMEKQSKNLIYNLLETIYNKREERRNWLSLNKKDCVQRSSLFIRLTTVRTASGGFVDCDCVVDLERMKDVIEFKYDRLKTLIPKHYANELEISNQALLEFISPWNVYDNNNLKISFIINPFWIQILERGSNETIESEYKVIYSNPN